MNRILVYFDFANKPIKVGEIYENGLASSPSLFFSPSTAFISNPRFSPFLSLPSSACFLNAINPVSADLLSVFGIQKNDDFGNLIKQKQSDLSSSTKKSSFTDDSPIVKILADDDRYRLGAFRFKADDNGDFESNSQVSIPNFSDLESIAKLVEAFLNNQVDANCISALSASSFLTGTRPKAQTNDKDGNGWIAKFPLASDPFDFASFEMLSLELAHLIGLSVSDFNLVTLANGHSVFLTRRFDRKGSQRLQYYPASEVIKKAEGEKLNYLDLVNFVRETGGQSRKDLKELFQRLILSLAISGEGLGLDNEGFIFQENGWVLAPLFSLRPSIINVASTRGIDGAIRPFSFDEAVKVCSYFSLSKEEAKRMVAQTCYAIQKNIDKLAKRIGIDKKRFNEITAKFLALN